MRGYANENYFMGHCPFHDDRNPSFQCWLDNGNWKCYSGCGNGDFKDLKARLGESLLVKKVEVTKPILIEKKEIELVNAIPQWFLDRGFTLGMCMTWKLKSTKEGQLYIPCFDINNKQIGYVLRILGGHPKYKYSDKNCIFVFQVRKLDVKLILEYFLVEQECCLIQYLVQLFPNDFYLK